MPFAFYNDTDEYCCEWLENLIMHAHTIIPLMDVALISTSNVNSLKHRKMGYRSTYRLWEVALYALPRSWHDRRTVL